MKQAIYLTVDMEEWFHLLDCAAVPPPAQWTALESRIEGNTHRLLDQFDLQGVKSTWFVLGWIAERYPNLVREVQARGHVIGCHSYWHSLVWQQTPQAFRAETTLALKMLQDTCGTPITAYRAPGFSITSQTPWAFDILAELGITVDASVFPGHHSHGGVGSKKEILGPYSIDTPSGRLQEFPMSIVRFGPLHVAYAGGGYFRLLPWGVIELIIRRRAYTMTYFHPRDFDAKQPRIETSISRGFKSYYGLDSSFKKLEELIGIRQKYPLKFNFHTIPIL